MKVLLVDCRDSFTYNLARTSERVLEKGDELEVVRTDKLKVSKVVSSYDKILLSPGPGVPSETENLMELIDAAASFKPILGVCLGHQALAEAFGAILINLSEVFHGISSEISLTSGSDIFSGLPEKIRAGRYHSWLVSEENFPSELKITARDGEGRIMGFDHRTLEIRGVQFHPESILTPLGPRILRNFLYGGQA
jgi:anthranilate synthase component 2